MVNPIGTSGIFGARSGAQLGSLIASGTLSPVKLALVQGALHSQLQRDKALREAFLALRRFEGNPRVEQHLHQVIGQLFAHPSRRHYLGHLFWRLGNSHFAPREKPLAESVSEILVIPPTTPSAEVYVGLESIAAPAWVESQCTPEGYVYAASDSEQGGVEPTKGRKILSESAGKENIAGMTIKAINLYQFLTRIFGQSPHVRVDSSHPQYEIIRRRILTMISEVLTQLPLHGIDGPPGKRSYHAFPMGFIGEAQVLRDIGELLHPDNFNSDQIRNLVREKYELYKFEVKVPSRRVGYNIDGGSLGRDIDYLVFEMFDGGRVLRWWRRHLQQMVSIKIFLDPEPKFILDLTPGYANLHDINDY